MIITNEIEFIKFKAELKQYENIFVHITYNNHLTSNYDNDPMFTYVCLLDNELNVVSKYTLNHNHYDIPYKVNIEFEHKNIYTLHKNIISNHVNKNNTLYDIHLLSYLFDNNKLAVGVKPKSTFKQFYDKEFYNDIVPITKHINNTPFNTHLTTLQTFKEFLGHSSYLYYNNLLETLYDIEKNGISVISKLFNEKHKNKTPNHKLTDDLIYSEYNIYTTTGRPSNRFGGINFNGLNKKTDRDWIVSRYGTKGTLVEFDYSAYHLSILAYLMNYVFPDNIENAHVYLGCQYFNTKKLTTEEYKKTKELNFKFLYGRIPKDVISEIPFFANVEKFIEQEYDKYLNNGYIESPMSSRRLYNMEKPTPNKVLNYLIQMVETELTITNISNVFKIINNKRINIILYTYDSILIDIHNSELDILDDVKTTLEDGKFKITVKKSITNYKNIK